MKLTAVVVAFIVSKGVVNSLHEFLRYKNIRYLRLWRELHDPPPWACLTSLKLFSGNPWIRFCTKKRHRSHIFAYMCNLTLGL